MTQPVNCYGSQILLEVGADQYEEENTEMFSTKEEEELFQKGKVQNVKKLKQEKKAGSSSRDGKSGTEDLLKKFLLSMCEVCL